MLPDERKELCTSNSSSILDLWNNRYLHLESIDYYEVNPKNTISLIHLRNNKISAKKELLLHYVTIIE